MADTNKFLLSYNCFFKSVTKHDKIEVILIFVGVYVFRNVSECVRFCVRMAYLEGFSP